jgi:2,3,4,5-tetrahydropyridine-2-carboxylate N-succinyltransferase
VSTETVSGAVAVGLATIAEDGTVLDTWFPAPELAAEPGPSGTVVLEGDDAGELAGAVRVDAHGAA